VEEPVGLTAVYLERGEFTLELLHYDRPGNPGPAKRVLNEPGLTHLSFTVGDLTSALDAVVTSGGTVVESTNVRGAVMVKDPDGQLLELIPRSQG
jgi:catechol 2,3-dioxygenase-like lactoylglutathione lyase family enzyme